MPHPMANMRLRFNLQTMKLEFLQVMENKFFKMKEEEWFILKLFKLCI